MKKNTKTANHLNTCVTGAEESPLQSIIDKMLWRIAQPDTKTKKLKEIIVMAVEMRAGLLEPGGLPENDWWANKAIEDFTEVIVRANHRAHQIINPGITMNDLEEQIKEAKAEIPELKKKATCNTR
jgi:hypothetical protein